MLFDGLDVVPSLQNLAVQPGSSEVLLEWGPLSHGEVYGAYIEFDVLPMGSERSWELREVFAPTGTSLLTPSGLVTLAEAEGGDGRGTWGSNRATVIAPEVAILEVENAWRLRLADSAPGDNPLPPDNCWLSSNSLDTEAKGNKGRYGCLYIDSLAYPSIRIGYRVLTDYAGTLSLYLAPANHGGSLLGAAIVNMPASGASNAGGIAPVTYPAGVLLGHVFIPVRSYGAVDAFHVAVTVAGGAATPFDIILHWRPD